ncbi:porin family protein [Faecalibacter bovis]|uniref:PorT family protein n=1 Tax=Faecalibacter bovis TaxID=2898187 RepID=A0ABX7XGG7_9FLAO|nr:outer membrane beta-barrel protein [Faecalibacter bovis]QTV06953.1 PorT family protein [Faecalibacter bovis]
MKKILFTALVVVSSFVSAQGIDFGAKAGVVFNANDGFWEGMDGVSKAEGSTGFQVGAVLRARFAGFYVQPELLYTQTSNEYNKGKVKKKSMDIPVGVGKRFLGIAHAQIGPTFSYYFEDKLDVGNFVNASQDQFGLGFHIGGGVQIKNLMFDLRYQKGFGKLTSEFVQGSTKYQTENTPQNINLSVTYLF